MSNGRVYFHQDDGWVIETPEGDRRRLSRMTEIGGVIFEPIDPPFLHMQETEETVPRPAGYGVTRPWTVPVHLAVEGLVVQIAERKRSPLLHRFSGTPIDWWRRKDTKVEQATFTLKQGELTGLIGPSGAGKSCLVKGLAGVLPSSGVVTFNAQGVTSDNCDRLRLLLGYLPQEDDTMHSELRLEDALLYAAHLRLPQRNGFERHSDVATLLDELGLTMVAQQPLGEISGGERRRASAAPELLTRPPILLLDEPTTGLDPDAERDFIEILKGLAGQGHSILMATHSVAAMQECNKLIVVANGKLAYVGARDKVLQFFVPESAHLAEADRYAEMYGVLRDSKTDWAEKFRGSKYRVQVERDFVDARDRMGIDPLKSASLWARPTRQLLILIRRNVAVIRGSSYVKLLAFQAPVLAVALLLFLGFGNLNGNKSPRSLAVFLVFAAVAMGLMNSCREIVKELPIFEREQLVGLSRGAYVGSKFLCLAGLCAVQSFILSLVMIGQGGSGRGVLLPSTGFEVWVILFVTMLATVASGLAISAFAKSDSQAQVLIPIVLVLQLLFTGAFLDTNKFAMQQVGYVTPAYWSFSATATSIDMLNIEHSCPKEAGRPVSSGPVQAGSCSRSWRHTAGSLHTALAWLTLLTVGYLGLAYFKLWLRYVEARNKSII
jgi:ABC-type multidrug transport system ATPase subunit